MNYVKQNAGTGGRVSIAVVLTVRNGASHIDETLLSIEEQTRPPECVSIVDDGSTDATLCHLERYERNSRSRVHIQARGAMGRGKALNSALSAVDTEFVAIVDVDDPLHPQRLEKLSEWLRGAGRDVCAIGGRLKLILGNEHYRAEGAIDTASATDVSDRFIWKNQVAHSSLVLKKSALDGVGGYDESRSSQFDYELLTRLVQYGYRVFRADAEVGAKRSHCEQSFERRKRLSYLLSSAKVQYAFARSRVGAIPAACICATRLAYGSLPNRVRMLLKQIRAS